MWALFRERERHKDRDRDRKGGRKAGTDAALIGPAELPL